VIFIIINLKVSEMSGLPSLRHPGVSQDNESLSLSPTGVTPSLTARSGRVTPRAVAVTPRALTDTPRAVRVPRTPTTRTNPAAAALQELISMKKV
jgi:hypothetical protein